MIESDDASRYTLPVVDCEPPPVGMPLCPPPSRTALHRARPRKRETPPAHREHGHATPPEPPPSAAACGFADAALRSVLEVIDRRRPVTQLRRILTGGLVDAVAAMAGACAHDEGAAVLRRVRLRAAGLTAAEVFATYTRGGRVRAIAGRVELRTGPAGPRWQLVALQIG